MENKPNQVVVHFVRDSETSVSWETASSLTTILGTPSLEALIQHALVRLKNGLEKAYPPDDGLPTAEHLATIEQLVPKDKQLTVISSLFGDEADKPQAGENEFNLAEMMSKVTEENKHDHIDINNSVASKITDKSFTILISLESIEQLQTRWRQQMRSLDQGDVVPVTKRLSFETWDDFLNIFSDKGKAMVEMLRKG